MKRECRKFKILLNRHHDGEASAEERALLRRHLAECLHCREEASALEKISRYFQEGEKLRASEGFTDGVLREVKAEISFSPWVSVLPTIKKLAVAAVIVMMISFSVLAFQGQGGQSESAGSGWKGPLSTHTFSREERAVFFGVGEGLTPESARKVWSDLDA